jgi:energy-coupling factor transporter transmembrane protein EcfT
MVVIASTGLLFGLDSDFTHAVVGLLVMSVCAILGIAGARYSRRSLWSGLWPVFLLGPFGLFIAWTYPVLSTEPRADRSL